MSRRVLVTGAGGFLGRAVAELCLRAGDQVQTISRRVHPEVAELGVAWTEGDLADAAAVRRAAEGCDLVIHVAARPGAWGPFREYYATNVLGTRNILQACRTLGIPDLVFTSTPSVVSRGVDLCFVDESLPYPDSYLAAYPQTKALAEREVCAAADPTLRTVALRPHLVWGPRDHSLLPRLVHRARRGRLRRVGAVEKLIDVTYIEDAARAHLDAATALQTNTRRVSGKAFFISSGQAVGNWTMIDSLLAAAGEPPVTRRISARAAYFAGALLEATYKLLRRRAEPPITRWVAKELSTAHYYDISAARRELGFAPQTELAAGLEALASWWQEEGRHVC